MIHYQGRWAVVTGASSGLGRGLAVRLADRGISPVLTGRNVARLDQVAQEIRRAAPQVKVETAVADLSTVSGVSALLEYVGDRQIEVLINNAGFGSYGPFAEADAERENEEVAVDVSAVISLARAFLPGMIAQGAVEFSTWRPRSRSSPLLTRPCTERARHSCCRSVRPSGPKRVGPAWQSPHCVLVPLAQGSSTRFARMLPTLQSTASLLTRGLSSRPGCEHWTRAEPWSFPACGTGLSPKAFGSCRASGSPAWSAGGSVQPAQALSQQSLLTTRSSFPHRPNECGIC